MKKDEHTTRPPVVAVLGHIDHGKSSLLDYIRKSNVVATEKGGITQAIRAYEVERGGRRITFIDTPGHEAFGAMRSRGAEAADIAILVVSAEEGVKPQTLEALASIATAKRPYVVAITKIDKPNANVERVKMALVENGVYLEGHGGDIPYAPISSKTGEGIDSLLDLILLVADIAGLATDSNAPGEGVIMESNRDPRRGNSATLIVRSGTVRSGTQLVAGVATAPVRILEDFLGKGVKEMGAGRPALLVGWSEVPPVGTPFVSIKNKREAEELARNNALPKKTTTIEAPSTKLLIPIIIKADTEGSLEALEHEIAKFTNDRIGVKMVARGVGAIAESDLKLLSSDQNSIVLGFNVSVDPSAKDLAERLHVSIPTFDIIYKLTEWLTETLTARAPKVETEEHSCRVKVLKTFSSTKDKQILGGRVEEGALAMGDQVKIIRRGIELAKGRVLNLQTQKINTKRVETGSEFGAEVESKIEIVPGDELRSFTIVSK